MLNLNPPAVYAAAEQRQSARAESIDFEQKLRRQLFQGENRLRGRDGRTYNYIDRHGEYVSSFLSPYNQKILDNVEPGVKALVARLINQGYLTASSCQGHRDQRTRFVIVAFDSAESRSDFVNYIDSKRLPIYWYTNFVNSQDSPKQPEQREGMTLAVNMRDRVYATIEEQRAAGYTLQDLTNYWNIMFSRSYERYYPIQMCICSLPGDCSKWQQFKTLCQWPLRNYYTDRLVKSLDDLPHYLG